MRPALEVATQAAALRQGSLKTGRRGLRPTQLQFEGVKQRGDVAGFILYTVLFWLLLICRLCVGKNGKRKILI